MNPEASPGSMHPSREGELLAGKYQLLRKLGEGGMGVVYEARHQLVGRHFAVKLLQRELAKNDEAMARFQREAQAAGALESEHVVAVTDYGYSDSGAPYMVMELLRGEDLRTIIRREGPLPVPRLLDLILQACRALTAAHGQGIIHRDLKPDNLFVTRRDDGSALVKVLDFGIAKLRREARAPVTTQAGQMLGTLAYMPAEQVRGEKEIDHRADVYALGAILYEGLCGELPHPGDEAHVIIYHILNHPPVPLGKLRPDLPQGLCATVHQALAHHRDDRPASVDELAQALRPYASGASQNEARPSRQYVSADQPTIPDSFDQSPAPAPGPATQQPVVTLDSPRPPRRRVARWVTPVVLAAAGLVVVLSWQAWRSPAEPSEAGSAAAESEPIPPPVQTSAAVAPTPVPVSSGRPPTEPNSAESVSEKIAPLPTRRSVRRPIAKPPRAKSPAPSAAPAPATPTPATPAASGMKLERHNPYK